METHRTLTSPPLGYVLCKLQDKLNLSDMVKVLEDWEAACKHASMLTEIRSYKAADGRSRLFIEQRDDGFFMYSAETLHEFDRAASPGHVPCFVPLQPASGLYQSADEAEVAGRRLLGWTDK